MGGRPGLLFLVQAAPGPDLASECRSLKVHSPGPGLVLPLTHITPSHALKGRACTHPFNPDPLLSGHWPLPSKPWPQPTPQQPSSFTSFESDPRPWWLLPLYLHNCPCPLLQLRLLSCILYWSDGLTSFLNYSRQIIVFVLPSRRRPYYMFNWILFCK